MENSEVKLKMNQLTSLLRKSQLKLLKNQFNNNKLNQLQPRVPLISQVLLPNKPNKTLLKTFSRPSPSVISKELTLLQETKLHPKKTLLKVDMLTFFSLQLLKSKLCSLFMKTLLISSRCMTTLKPSECSPRTLVSVLEKLNYSTKDFQASETSIH